MNGYEQIKIDEPELNNNSPDLKSKKSIRHFNGSEIGKEFINYFYGNWIHDPSIMLTENIIKPYSKLVFNSTIYEGSNFVDLLNIIKSDGLNFENCQTEIFDSGSRQIYILVTGLIKNNTGSNYFSQSFMIAYSGEKHSTKWSLMNSLLKIV